MAFELTCKRHLTSHLTNLLLVLLIVHASCLGQDHGPSFFHKANARRLSQSCSGTSTSCFNYGTTNVSTTDVMNIVGAEMSAISYNDSSTAIANAQQLLGATQSLTIDNPGTDTHILVAITSQSIMFAFRGTLSTTNFMTDGNANLGQFSFGAYTASVHQGFYGAIQSVYADVSIAWYIASQLYVNLISFRS